MIQNDRIKLTGQVGGTRNGELVLVPAGTEGVVVQADPIVVVIDTPGGEYDMTRVPDLIENQVEVI